MHVYVHTLMHTGIQLDNAAFMMDRSYKLVVSTPGAKDVLTRDREFVAFKGFPISGTARESQGSWGKEGEESEEGGGSGGAWVVVGRQAEHATGLQKMPAVFKKSDATGAMRRHSRPLIVRADLPVYVSVPMCVCWCLCVCARVE